MKNINENNLDKILIRDLRLRCIIGVNDWERKEKQDVTINVVIWSDLTEASKTDDIRKTIDYKEIAKDIIKLVEKSKFLLVETLAERIAQACLQNGKVKKVRVTVEKPGALRFAKNVGVQITRRKGQFPA